MGVLQASIPVHRLSIALAVLAPLWLGPAGPALARGGRATASSSGLEWQPVDLGAASRALTLQGVGLAPGEGDATLSALRATIWSEGDVQRIYVEGWVRASIGPYEFSAQRAVGWISRHDEGGGIVNEIALYLER